MSTEPLITDLYYGLFFGVWLGLILAKMFDSSKNGLPLEKKFRFFSKRQVEQSQQRKDSPRGKDKDAPEEKLDGTSAPLDR